MHSSVVVSCVATQVADPHRSTRSFSGPRRRDSQQLQPRRDRGRYPSVKCTVSHTYRANGSLSWPRISASVHTHRVKSAGNRAKLIIAASSNKVSAVDGVPGEDPPSKSTQFLTGVSFSLVALTCTAVALAVTNRVLYKIAIVPLQNHLFFLAQLMTFGYVVVYFTTLAVRVRMGKVTPAMLALPKAPFVAMGALESCGLVLGLLGASHLPGSLITVYGQLYTVWQLLLSAVFLKRRYTIGQLLFVALGLFGVGTASLPAGVGGLGDLALSREHVFYSLLFICGLAPPAASTILKETVFKRAKKALGGRPLDLFVVNSFGSLFQALFTLLFIPLIASLQGISLPNLPQYLLSGARCMAGIDPNPAGAPTPLIPLMYVAANLVFNITMLRLLRATSAVYTSLTMTVTVPLTVIAFAQPLPYLDPNALGARFLWGTVLLVIGLAGYNVLGQRAAQSTEAGELTEQESK